MNRAVTESEEARVAPPSPKAEGHTLPPHEPWGWTRRQRVGLGILLGLLVVFLGLQYWRRPFRLDDSPVVLEGQPMLPQRVDPNVATAQELARIPHIGEALADKIVAYREARKGIAAGGVVFRQAGDLDAVPGIGKKLVEQLGPFLKFPEDEGEPGTQDAP